MTLTQTLENALAFVRALPEDAEEPEFAKRRDYGEFYWEFSPRKEDRMVVFIYHGIVMIRDEQPVLWDGVTIPEEILKRIPKRTTD